MPASRQHPSGEPSGTSKTGALALREVPHRRRNALTGEWLLVSPHRTQRPWHGHTESRREVGQPAYDPDCYLCPGNLRVGGAVNPRYASTFVFDNDFPALTDVTVAHPNGSSPLLVAAPVRGACRVVCFSPRHDLRMSAMEPRDIRSVVDVWADETASLGARYRWVQIFENNGAMMGCSNPHPHGQIWATSDLPWEAVKEDACQREHFDRHGRPLLADYLLGELDAGERIIVENEDWAAVVPFWAVWPFEALLIPRAHRQRLPDLTDCERDSLAGILRTLGRTYDGVFDTDFPYSMGWHGAPEPAGRDRHWTLHAHFYPPLLRSASVKKFLVGYEMLAEPQRDLTPEAAAERLRSLAQRSESSHP
jgi:UDPglucose--hexose-1-phosphate uridylyltransferase